MIGRLAPLCIALVAAAGCYAYLPLSVAPTPGTYLSADLTESATDELARYLGSDIGTVRGRLVASDQGGLALSVLAVESRRGEIGNWKGETVKLPRWGLAGLSERRLSTGRTVLLVGAGILGFVAASHVFVGATGSAPNGGAGPPVPR